MGTPDFAVSSLRALHEGGYRVIAAVTQADKPQGRGYKLVPPPVKVYAEAAGIPVYQPSTLRSEEFARLLSELGPDVIVVAAYGKILPHNVIAYPKYGCVNVHGSLLPEYRGAAPMQRAIIDGKAETGITTMLMDDGLDTGDMLMQKRVPIGFTDNFETVHDRMAEAGASLLLDTLENIKTLKRDSMPQAFCGIEPTYAKKIEKEDCLIDFSKPSEVLHDLIRGLSPVPLAFTHTPDGKLLKIVEAAPGDPGEKTHPGTVVSLGGGEILVSCGSEGEERIRVLRVLPEGKGRMSAADFIRGRKIAEGQILG